MEHIRKQLNININKSGLSRIAQSARICYLFNSLKNELIKDINGEAASFKNGKLVIVAHSSPEASEIRFRSGEIKKELNKKFKDDLIKNIEVKITI